MSLSRDRTVRRPVWALLGAALLLAAVVPVSIHVHAQRERDASARMASIAERVPAPAVMHELVLHHDCNGDSLVRCGWTSDQDVDGLARRARTDLGRTAAMPARTHCSDVPGRAPGRLRSCVVSVGDSSHRVTIFLDPYVRPVDGQVTLVGSQYTVSAD